MTGKAGEGLGEKVGIGNVLEDDVDAAPAGQAAGLRGQVLRAIVDAGIGAEPDGRAHAVVGAGAAMT